MARYIKANPKVAAFLHLENDRNQLKDGNYLLWQADMLAFGRLIELPAILAMIGGVALQPYEARAEQDGTACVELPEATDPRFIVEKAEPAEDPETLEPGQEDAPADTQEGDKEPEENSEPGDDADQDPETEVEPTNDEDDEHSEHQQND